MHGARRLIGMALVLALATAAPATTPSPYTATVVDPEVEARSGPSATYYATSKLQQGQPVTVVREEPGGWLAVLPPVGSFSWINARNVEVHPSGYTATVTVAEADVRVGSRLHNQPPTVQQVKLQQGAQVIVIGKPMTADNVTWLPILPPPQEVRYIAKDKVRGSPPVQAAVAAAQLPAGAAPAVTVQPGAPGNMVMDPLWLQAEQAMSKGDIAGAYAAYRQLADQTADADLRFRCQSRMAYLRESNPNAFAQAPLPGASTSAPGAVADARPAAAATPATAMSPPGRVYSQYGASPTPGYPAAPAAPPAAQPAPAPTTAQWSGWGRLTRSSLYVNGQPAYNLESSQGQLLLSVTPQAGLSLEPFVGRNVNLFGAIAYHPQMRRNLMTVVQVAPLP